ncbi:MAG: hypothetical protein ABI723_12960 [Bacteroidia bacterium]
MNTTETIQISMLLLAVISTTIAIGSYRRNKKIELENHLYKIKLEALSNIVFEIDKMFKSLDKALDRISDIDESARRLVIEDKLFGILIQADAHVIECDSLMVKYSVYFPTKSTDALYNFSMNLISHEINFDKTLSIASLEKVLDKYYAKQLANAEIAVDLLRTDLHLEKLNQSLYKRVKS